MKKNKTTVSYILKTALFLFLIYISVISLNSVSIIYAVESDAFIAVITSIDGPVQIGENRLPDYKNYSADEAGNFKLKIGDYIRTPSSTHVTIKTTYGAQFDIKPDTVIQLGVNSIRLKNGALWINYKAISSGGEVKFEVQTSQATMGIKGTEFAVRESKSGGRSYLQVKSGCVNIKSEGGADYDVNAGEAAAADAEKIQAPVKMGDDKDITEMNEEELNKITNVDAPVSNNPWYNLDR